MLPLTSRELEIYTLYKSAIEANQKLPTIREIAKQLNISYTAVHTYLGRVIEKGYLVRVVPQALKLAELE